MGRRTYAVTWSEEDGHVFAGKLEVGAAYVRLEGWSGHGPERLRVFHKGDITRIATERRNDHRELLLDGYGRRIAVNVIEGAGAMGELLDELQKRV
jgi:hypothetical protein